MTYDYATDNGATDDTDYVYYPETGNTSTLQISGSIDAAAASLQLGTDREETQVIEMGSQDVTTTIYGTVTLVHAVNASAIAVTNNLVVGGKATLTNASVTTMDVGALGVGALQVNGITTCTLGHDFVGPVIGHPYFGRREAGQRHILDDLVIQPGWASGFVTWSNLSVSHDPDTGFINGFTTVTNTYSIDDNREVVFDIPAADVATYTIDDIREVEFDIPFADENA